MIQLFRFTAPIPAIAMTSALPNIVHAQAPATTGETSGQRDGEPRGEDSSNTESKAIVVTGSRIARTELVNPMPISVVDRKDALRFNNNDLYSLLQQNPALGFGGTGLNSSATDRDSGARLINLRKLDINRPLRLIDGRRRVPGSTRPSAADIATIPLGMMDRVEIITGAASQVRDRVPAVTVRKTGARVARALPMRASIRSPARRRPNRTFPIGLKGGAAACRCR